MKYILALLALCALASAAFAAAPFTTYGQDNTSWNISTGGYSCADMIYDPATYTWGKGTETGVDSFAVKANIEMWLDMSYETNNIEFHIGKNPGPNPSFSSVVHGNLQSNNGMYIFVSKDNARPGEADLTTLKFKHNIFNGSSPANCPDIPVTWELRDTQDYRAGTYSTGGNNGQVYGITWLLDNGVQGNHPFDIRCTIKPDQYQPDGYYEMDPVLVASPPRWGCRPR